MNMRKINYFKKRMAPMRSKNGSVGILIPCGTLLMIFGIGAFCADLVHNTLVRAELQNACDAGALAGASALINASTNPQAETFATNTTASNFADGVSVSATTPNTTVVVNVNRNVPNEMGQCQVSATHQINNWLGALFSHGSDTIAVTATAACSKTVSGVAPNALFPIAVSIDAVPTSKTITGKPLKDVKVGEDFQIFINSQQIKNAGFTSMGTKNTNANWLNQAIDQSLGIAAPVPNFIPGVNIGDPIYLDNGVTGQKTLAQHPRLSKLQGMDIALPVVEGTPPFNQSRPVVGWVVVRIKSVTVNQSGGEVETLTGSIIKAPIRGIKGSALFNSGDAQGDVTLQSISPGNVRLIFDPYTVSG